MGQGLKHIERCRHAKSCRKGLGRRAADIIIRMQHKSATALDRAAEMHADIAALGRGDVELIQQFGKAEIGDDLVDDQPHRAVFAMGADQDHCMFKARILQSGHGEQKFSGQIHRAFLGPGACV